MKKARNASTAPIIGVLSEINDEQIAITNRSYVKPIEHLGALPLVLPFVDTDSCTEAFVESCDGFLFTGGKDVEPSRYGEETKPGCGIIQKYRDEYELRVFKAALKTGKPILGICRGTQLINVGLGGTLYQDIPSECPSEIFHRQQESTYSFSHSVNIACGTPLYELVEKERIRANSFHHQSIKALGRNLAVMATADDGVIEAVYGTSKQYVRGYQWHPERLFDKDEENFAIFKDFISACQKSKEL